MTMNGMRALVTGRGLVESPRWHGDRLYYSDWSAGEVIAVDLEGHTEVVAGAASCCTPRLRPRKAATAATAITMPMP